MARLFGAEDSYVTVGTVSACRHGFKYHRTESSISYIHRHPNCLSAFTTIFSWLENKTAEEETGLVTAPGRSGCPGWSRRGPDADERGRLGMGGFRRAPTSVVPSRWEPPFSRRWWCVKVSLEQVEPSRVQEQGGAAVWSPRGLRPQRYLDPLSGVCGAAWGSEGWGSRCWQVWGWRMSLWLRGGDEPTRQKARVGSLRTPLRTSRRRQVCYQTILWCSCLGTNGSRGTASDRGRGRGSPWTPWTGSPGPGLTWPATASQLWGLRPEVFLLPFLFYFTCPTQAEGPKPIPAGATHSEAEANFCNKHFWFKTKKKIFF